MPTYEYYCSACDRDIEVFQSMRDDPLTLCPQCEKPHKITRKISGGAGIIFKGSGFYETDYKRSAKGEDGGDGSSGDGSKPGGSDGSKPGGDAAKPGGATAKDAPAKPSAEAKAASGG